MHQETYLMGAGWRNAELEHMNIHDILSQAHNVMQPQEFFSLLQQDKTVQQQCSIISHTFPLMNT
jgi:hypothetical protein